MFRTHSALAFLLFGASAIVWAESGGAEPRLTGAPGDSNCTGCHNGTAVNGGGGSVKIVLSGDATYTPGVKQHITVQVSDSAQRRWGFELTARLNSSSSKGQAGSLTATDSQAQVFCDVTGRKPPCSTASVVQFITHTSTGTRNGTTGGVSFAFDWTPPATDVGAVTLYAAGNAANGNGANSGDHIYTTSIQLTPATMTPKPTITSTNGVVSAATTSVPGTAPASWITINGTSLSNTTRIWTVAEASAGLPVTLDGVSVQVNGKPAFIQSISPAALVVLTPSDSSTGPVNVQVTNNGVAGDSVSVTMAALAPALLTADGKYLVTSHGDNPLSGRVDNFPGTAFPAPTVATAGEVISFYGTGFGAVNPALVDGVLQSAPAALTGAYSVSVGGETAQVSYAGLAPGFAAVYQFKTTIPADLATGDQPVVIQIGGLSTQKSVFVQVQAAAVVPPKPAIGGVVSAAASAVTGMAPASWIAINGTNLSNSTRTWTVAEATALTGLPTLLDGVSVQVNQLAAFVQAVSPTQLMVLTPSDTTVGQINVQVTNNGVVSDASTVTMAALAPALITVDGKYLVTTHDTTPLGDRLDVFPSTLGWPVAKWPVLVAAKPGETISFYGTGFGVTDPVIVDGQLQVNPVSATTPYTLSLGGEQVTASFAGMAPGFAGVYQFTAVIPTDLPNGDQPVMITMGGLSTVQSDKCCFIQVQSGSVASTDGRSPFGASVR